MSEKRTMNSSLDSSLLSLPCDELARSDILDTLWATDHGRWPRRPKDTNIWPFWTYYKRECEHALHDAGRHVAVRTHRDILELATQVKADMKREEIKDHLRQKFTKPHANEEELLENSVDLTASLLTMCHHGNGFSHGFSGQKEVQWKDSQPLRAALAEYFAESPVLAHEKVKLGRAFTGRNLQRIAGIEVVWTDNLLDHLRLTNDDTKVHVFHHASFLEWNEHSNESLLPFKLAAETLRTLALLFPSDAETKKWLSKLPEADQQMQRCGRLNSDKRQIEQFNYWRDRIVMLKQVFDDAQPKNLSQWWHDRRSGVQWYTFWVAILVLALTVFFGLVQSIEGAMQVYASFKSL